MHPRTRLPLVLGLLLATLLSGCLNDTVQPTLDPNAPQLSGTAITLPTSSPQPELTPTPTIPDWLPPLLEAGPPALVSSSIFFLNGPDAWLIDEDLSAHEVTRERRVRAVATIPGAQMAAILLVDSAGGRESEEIRIVDAGGNASEPIYGPEIVGDPGGNPRISILRWSPDGQRLAIVRDDASIWLAGPERSAIALELQEPLGDIEDVDWSPAGTALVFLQRSTDSAGTLRVIAIGSGGGIEIRPRESFNTVSWSPDRGLLIVSEDRSTGPNPNAGSLFTVEADGSNRELLISAGELGPAIEIGTTALSPDGRQLAFTVEAPDASGDFLFQALYLLDFTTGIRRQIEVFAELVVSDLWWFEGGLAWRAIEAVNGSKYSGVEPFVIEVADLASGESKLLYTSDGT